MTNRTIALSLAGIGCGMVVGGAGNPELMPAGQFVLLLAILFCVLPPAPPESK